jgi:hypothetical protein
MIFAPMKRKKIFSPAILFLISAWLFFSGASGVLAQNADNIGLTITPPLVKNKMEPGGIWNSTVKVVNNGKQPIDIYVQVADYKSGENGGPEFIQNQDRYETASYALSQWIEVGSGPYNIDAQKSAEIPYSIVLPATADPGGHYAALLIGTRPKGDIHGSGLQISSLLASLIMLEVTGDILERGQIREFSAGKIIFTEPDVKFNVNFENTGNVHLLPQGEISITDWFGRKKGRITINHATDYGNVLPKSIRKWDFTWRQDKNIFEMGRYRAELVLGYGSQARQTDTHILYFWLIYPKLILIILGPILAAVVLIFLSLKFYIRRAIIRTSQEAGLIIPLGGKQKLKISVIPQEQSGGDYHANIKQKTVLKKEPRLIKDVHGLFRYLGIILAITIIIAGGLYYFYFLSNNRKTIERQTDNRTLIEADDADNGQAKVSAADQARAEEPIAENISSSTAPEMVPAAVISTSSENIRTAADELSVISIKILNGSGIAGQGGKLEDKLKASGYKIIQVGNALDFNYQNNIISHRSGFSAAAETISGLVAGAAEIRSDDEQAEDIIIIIGGSYTP